jgi:hypothetical protein
MHRATRAGPFRAQRHAQAKYLPGKRLSCDPPFGHRLFPSMKEKLLVS